MKPPVTLFLFSALVWAVSTLQPPSVAQAVHPAGPAPGRVGFETSENCLACHNGMTTPAGEDVSIGVAWRASIMANSSRDPYWQAAVRREVMDHPTRQKDIENECAICHMPMARVVAQAAGRQTPVFELLKADSSSEDHQLAADGVSCTLCHQIGPERLGTRESFTGGFVLSAPYNGVRRMFGPFDVEAGLSSVMQSATGVQPAAADHVRQSELCATCHTLYTGAFDANGTVVGSLPEQVPYLEWQNSAFVKERSCQSCHMPAVEATPIASVLGKPRDHIARHTFLGGNFFILRMLNTHRRELGVIAPPSELDAAAHATLRQLETDTASVSLPRAERREDCLETDVVIRNLTGHKLPTAYPSRRAWIRFVVRDASGRTVFESGAMNALGAIDGNDNDADEARYESHYEEITTPDQVQIYESIMADPRGAVTTGLLRAVRFIKDNRLLPRGFDARTKNPDISVQGAARQDVNFTGDGDRVRYVVPVRGFAAPYQIEVELRYQPIGFRWADNLRPYDAPEPKRFVAYYQGMAAASSAILSRAQMTVP
jgi:hypothetical protein